MIGGIPKAQLMTGDAMHRALVRIAHEMMEQLDPIEDVVFVGIRRKGVPLAQRLANLIKDYEHVELPVGEVDITLFRDDLKPGELQISANEESLTVDVAGKTVVLVDDVLHTGRTDRKSVV